MIGQKVIEEIEYNFDKELYRYYNSDVKVTSRKRLLCNLFYNFYYLRNLKDNLDPFVLIGIEQLMERISDELIKFTFSHFFGNLYQIEDSLINRDYEDLQNQLSWTIYDLQTMNIQILQGSSVDDSLGSSFFDRLKGLVKTDCTLINRKSDRFFKLALINLCTVNSVLVDYIQKVNGEHTDIAKGYLDSSFYALRKAFIETEKTSKNLSYMLYVYLTLKKASSILEVKIEKIDIEYVTLMRKLESEAQNFKVYDLILSICNLYEIEKRKFKELFKENFHRLARGRIHWTQRPFYIRILIYFIQETSIKDRIELNVRPRFSSKNMDRVMNRLFPEYSSQKDKIKVKREDLAKLMSYGDSQIREKLVKVFRRSDYIPEKEKRRLGEEAKKPHTGYEISDFEVELNSGLFVCKPIKSAKEITTPTVPESYVYQVMKPFTKLYKNCAVIFITSKRCSQSLDTYIKQLKSLHEFPIEVIQENQLCNLLKFYDQLD